MSATFHLAANCPSESWRSVNLEAKCEELRRIPLDILAGPHNVNGPLEGSDLVFSLGLELGLGLVGW